MPSKDDFKVPADLEVESSVPLEKIIVAAKKMGAKSAGPHAKRDGVPVSRNSGPRGHKRQSEKPAKESGPSEYKR